MNRLIFKGVLIIAYNEIQKYITWHNSTGHSHTESSPKPDYPKRCVSVSVPHCLWLISAFMNVWVFVGGWKKENRDPRKWCCSCMRKHFQSITLHVDIIRVKKESRLLQPSARCFLFVIKLESLFYIYIKKNIIFFLITLFYIYYRLHISILTDHSLSYSTF